MSGEIKKYRSKINLPCQKMDMTRVYTEAELTRAATIIDTEGCIFLHTKVKLLPRGKVVYIYLEVVVAMKTQQLVKWLYETFGGSFYVVKDQRTGHGNSFNVQGWKVRGYHAKAFLELIEPYLMIKNAQAKLAIKFQSRKRGVRGIEYCQGQRTQEIPDYEMYIRECFWKKMKQLNGSIDSKPNKFNGGDTH